MFDSGFVEARRRAVASVNGVTTSHFNRFMPRDFLFRSTHECGLAEKQRSVTQVAQDCVGYVP
jgi:hypothetical protein